MNQNQILVKLIQYNSQEYYQACQLRYRLFFAEHDLPWEIVLDDHDADSFHAAVVIQGCVAAYGKLTPQNNLVYRLGQIVVEPIYQRQNLGRQVVLTLIDLAKQQGAIAQPGLRPIILTLNSRLSAVGFYQKLGFQTFGDTFPSASTGVIHIAMRQKL